MSRYVRPGHTFQLTGTLAQGTELVALYGRDTAPAGAVLLVDGAFTNDGHIVVDGNFSASYGQYQGSAATLQNTGVLTNNGTISVTGPTPGSTFGPASVSVPPPEGGMLVNDGVLLNYGSITIGGLPVLHAYINYLAGEDTPAILQDNGYLHNVGSVYVAAYEVGYYNFGGDSPGQLNIAGVFVNDGVLTEAFGFYGKYGAGATINVSGTLVNHADGLITGGFSSNDGPLLDITASGTLLNAGTLVAAFSDNTGMVIDDQGLLRNSGILQLDGGGGGYADGRDGGGMLNVSGVLINSGRLLVNVRSSDQDYNNGPSGAALDNAGLLTNSGSLVVYGAIVSSYGVQAPGGTLLDTGTLTNTAHGVISLTGAATGYMAMGGGAVFDVGGVLDNDGLVRVGVGGAGGAVLTDSGLIRNQGTILVQGSTLAAAGVLIDSGRLFNGSLLTINAGSGAAPQGLTITTIGTLIDTGTINGSGTLVNDGLIGAGGTGAVIAVATLVNDGTITVAPQGSLDVRSDLPFGATGIFNIESDATLTVGGTVEFFQTVAFAGDNGTLAIGEAFAFFATLDLSQPDATLDFLARDVTSAILSGTTLQLGFNDGLSDYYHLTAPPPTGTTVSLRPDGAGGTDVIFGPAGAASGSFAAFSSTGHLA